MITKSLIAKSGAIAVGALMLSVTTTAQASLIGQTGIGCVPVDLGRAYVCNTAQSPVGIGHEFELIATQNTPSFTVDIGEDMDGRATVEIMQTFPGFSTQGQFTDFEFSLTDLIWLFPTGGNDPDSEITGLALSVGAGVSGMEDSDLTHTEDSLTINFVGSSWQQQSSILITLGTNHNPIATPEPGALALFGLGLAGLGYLRRRRSV